MYKIKKTIAGGLIFLSLFFISPQKTEAFYTDVLNTAKEYGLDTIVSIVVKKMISQITADTVKWINSGFQGNPAYVTDPGAFFLDIGDSQVSRMLSKNGALNRLCSPFRANVRLSLVKNYLRDTNEPDYSCTLSKIVANYDQFTGDFSQGGWGGWFEMTQNDSNNPYGAYVQSETDMNKKIDNQVKKYTDQLNRGVGFLNMEKCLGTEVLVPSTGKKYCEGATQTVTPGSVIQGQLQKVLPSGLDRIVAADEIDELITALLNQLISKTFSSSGLLGNSQPSGGRPPLIDEVSGEPREPDPIVPGEPPLPSCTDLSDFLCDGDISAGPPGPPGPEGSSGGGGSESGYYSEAAY
jgi:hypothetical protein